MCGHQTLGKPYVNSGWSYAIVDLILFYSNLFYSWMRFTHRQGTTNETQSFKQTIF